MHTHPPAAPSTSASAGRCTTGVVMCAHAFGVGVHLPELGDVGHVNTPHLVEPGTAVRDLDDLPPVGASLHLTVLGRSDGGQLRLAVHRPDDEATAPPARA